MFYLKQQEIPKDQTTHLMAHLSRHNTFANPKHTICIIIQKKGKFWNTKTGNWYHYIYAYIHAVHSIYAITFIFVDIETYSSGLNKLLKYKIEIYRVYIERKYKASMWNIQKPYTGEIEWNIKMLDPCLNPFFLFSTLYNQTKFILLGILLEEDVQCIVYKKNCIIVGENYFSYSSVIHLNLEKVYLIESWCLYRYLCTELMKTIC